MVNEMKRESEQLLMSAQTDRPLRPVEVLLVEDNPGDVRLTQEVLKDSPFPARLHVVGDGQEALDYLKRKGVHASAVRPDFILLDLNLPKKNGHEVLRRIKVDRELKRIPVAVLSSSMAQDDIVKSYNFYANCYIAKPVGLAAFVTAMTKLEDFWFGVARLSPQ
jgi:two-component system, chemotaxis family, response regulator Rcp1